MIRSIQIATRKSPLAWWQAKHVKTELQAHYPDLEIELKGMLTTADKLFATALNKIGGKGLFVKELEQAILDHEADLAVHSIKDMPAQLPDGLVLAAILPREEPRDVLVSKHWQTLTQLPLAATVGTSSLRRSAQVLAMRPDLKIKPLRGNVGTRLKKLDEGEVDALILAAAGLKRLQLDNRIGSYFAIEHMLPAAGQGAIGIECRSQDTYLINLINFLNHPPTRQCITAERSFNEKLGGSCQFPIAAYAVIHQKQLTLQGLVSDKRGKINLKVTHQGPYEQAREIGLAAAEKLIQQGASELLQEVLADNSDSW